MSPAPARSVRRRLSAAPVALATLAALLVPALGAPAAVAADGIPSTLSDVRVAKDTVTATLVLRPRSAVKVDWKSVTATFGSRLVPVTVSEPSKQPRSTMLVIDTSGSMGASGMATVRAGVAKFLAEAPSDVKVGVVSFASTSGIDVAPTTDRGKVSRAVNSLRSGGETSLYKGVQDAVRGLGTKGERSLLLLSDGGDTVAAMEGGDARAESQRQAALRALTRAKVRAEVVSFNSGEANTAVLQQFADAGGGSVANAADRAAVASAFSAAAVALNSQVRLTITKPADVGGAQTLKVDGTASGQAFHNTSELNLGDTAPVEVPEDDGPLVAPDLDETPAALASLTALSPALLVPAVAVVFIGVFVLSIAFAAPTFRSKRSERISAIDDYGLGKARSPQRQAASASAISESIVSMGEQLMEGRDSTTRTMELLVRADLPWRAGEWLVMRLVALVIGLAAGILLLGSHPIIGGVLGLVFGAIAPPFVLRFLAKRRARKFETVLPDVMMLVATSLASGFSLLQALDSVAKDAPEPAAKEFSRALAEARIGADVSDALDKMALRMDSHNMRWTTMAIRIQREVGGNLAETLRTTAATLREREMLRRQVKALSAEGRLSAYALVGLPIGLFFYSTWANHAYVSLLWTRTIGLFMLTAGIVAIGLGILWMRKIVKIEV
ncbi:type II secretion system F family protein [Phycicoccus sonneratiae]|uniref:Type II secretion system F family protein n=1 Tax=Phycicoccus sonneratiae TaxID=2807628 RepID=A0ABS2CM19_9MICO|nr:type II secretion system F family protein [Phycicoccus sonneraticus]MBM6400926.1 type II secretion system F family protein [Phycicoccus sonneraticus]